MMGNRLQARRQAEPAAEAAPITALAAVRQGKRVSTSCRPNLGGTKIPMIGGRYVIYRGSGSSRPTEPFEPSANGDAFAEPAVRSLDGSAGSHGAGGVAWCAASRCAASLRIRASRFLTHRL